MGRQSRTKNRRRNKRRKRNKKRRTHIGNRFSVAVKSLEIAKGHDGLLRGAPEPVILLSAYLLETGHARLLARTLHRVTVPRRFPCKVEPRQQELLTTSYALDGPRAILVLGIALEEDSGGGVQSVFAGLEAAHALSLWPQHEDVPTPLDLTELLAVRSRWHETQRVHVMRDGQYLSDRCVGDKWIGASAMIAPLGHRRSDHVRMHFVAADDRNDWTVELAIHN